MRTFTYSMGSGSISISASDGVTQLSIQANDASSCTVLGANSFQNISPSAISLSNGESLTLQAPTNSPLDGVTITWVGGTIDIVIVS